MLGKVDTAEVHAQMEPAMFDKIIKVMIDKNVHWSTDLGDLVSPALEFMPPSMKQRELALLRNPQLKYLPAYILKDTESFFAKYEKMAPEKRNELVGGLQDAAGFRSQVCRGGRQDSFRLRSQSRRARLRACTPSCEMLVEAGLTPVQAIQTAALNVAQAWGKEKEYGSVEKGKVADLVIVRGDPLKNISDTQNVEMVFMEGKKIDTSFHADYKNPMPRPIEDRPES